MAKKKTVAEELKAPAVKGLLRDAPDPTVYLNGVLRFDDDHIIRVKYDPTSKAMVIDDVPQSLESSITLGEGGGGDLLPKVTVSLTCNALSGHSLDYHNRIFKDGLLVDEGGELAPGATVEFDQIGSAFMDDGNYVAFVGLDSFISSGFEYNSSSDAVNCTYDSDEAAILITDPYQPASISIDVTCTDIG